MKTQGIGRTLRVEREARRVSLDSISRATMVRRDYLELIDADRLHDLPPGAYAKGFIRAYASYLGLDAGPFVEAYEHQCDQPAPELSAVVRQPVRVPNAAQPRALRIAAGGAVGLLLLLGILGLFRSSEPEEPLPEVSAEVAALLSSPAPNPLGTVVRIEVTGDKTWVEVHEDDEELFAGTLVRGERKRFQADRLRVTVGNPGAVNIRANGHDLGSPPAGESGYTGSFTPRSDTFPANEG